jgi:hypothetical protein
MIYVKHICSCSDRELSDFEWLASLGNTTPYVQLERVRFIGFAYEGDMLISCRALKLPYYAYKEKIFTAAQSRHHISTYYESGYSYTWPHYRGKGLSCLLLKMLLAKAPHRVYGTTLMHNTPIIKIFCKVGGRPVGVPFCSDNGMVMLWLLK